jgi:hypothetical protein
MQDSEEGQLPADEQSIPDGGFQAWATVIGGYALSSLMYSDQYENLVVLRWIIQFCTFGFVVWYCHLHRLSVSLYRYTNSYGVYQGLSTFRPLTRLDNQL